MSEINNIEDLYNIQKNIWKNENEKYFGLTPLNDWSDLEIVKNHLDECANKFWNNGTNELKKLFENGKCKDIDKLVPGSYELIFDHINELICLYAKFVYEKDNIETGKKEKIEKRAPLAYLPYPNDLCWFLNGSEYVLRISANINYSLLARTKNLVKYQKVWIYDSDTKEFNVLVDDLDPYESLTKLNRNFLEMLQGEEITKDNFTDALDKVPEFSNDSIANFRFGHVDEIFKLVAFSNRFANPLMKVSIPINIVKMFVTQKSKEDTTDNGNFSNLVLNANKLFALENCRTVIYKSMFNSSFTFSDCNKVFDSFKTSTNKSAGRSRLLLDTATVENGMIYNEINGKKYNMFELIMNDDLKVNNNLSVLSESNFSSSNDPKRLMMTAKLRTQAVKVVGENDQFTHEVPLRICFGDFKGFNYGDSIIMSRSAAKKLLNIIDSKTIKFRSKDDYLFLKKKYKVGDTLSVNDFGKITKSTMYNNYRNIKIIALESDYITVSADNPFSVGDKVTNLHGSKGIVSLILEDDQMPYLKDDITFNGHTFKKGPFEIIVSGNSVFKRKTTGQLFEGWAKAMNFNNVNNVKDAIDNYYDDLKYFGEHSVVCFDHDGIHEETIKPCGVNMVIRLNHDAVTKQVFSYVKSNYARMLKFGEMEELNLASRGMYNILNELDIRSVSKHYNSFSMIKRMQKTGECPNERANNLRFFSILRDIGFEFNLQEAIKYEDMNEMYLKLRDLLTDDQVSLFDENDKEGE